jgi:hypothetical protein
MQNTRYYCRILIKFEFSRQILEKISNTKFRQNPSSGRGVVPCGRTERQTERNDEASSCFSNFSKTPKNRQIQGYQCKLRNL